VHTQAELFAEVEYMSLGDTVAHIAIQEVDAMAAKVRAHTQTANSSTMFKDDRMNTKDSTGPRVQDIQDATALKTMPPIPMPPEHVDNVKMQLKVNINTNTCPDKSINQILGQLGEPLERHIARGCYHGTTPKTKNTPKEAHPQTQAWSRGGKAMPTAGVMRQQGIPRLNSTVTSTRGRPQLPTRKHANNRHGARNKVPQEERMANQ
jgi:hypothetical protein